MAFWMLEQPVHIEKKWGYELHVVNNHLYCGKVLTVLPNGMASSVHYHRLKVETLHVIKGGLYVELWKIKSTVDSNTVHDRKFWRMMGSICVTAGNALTLLPGEAHRFWTKHTVCLFSETSTTDDPRDSYRIIESGPAPKHNGKHPTHGSIWSVGRDHKNFGLYPMVRIPIANKATKLNPYIPHQPNIASEE